MKSISLGVLGIAMLLSSAAISAPINPTGPLAPEMAAVEQVRLICDQYGRCYRARGPRYVRRGYDDGYARRSDGYYGGGQGYYGGGPTIGLSFGNRGW